MDIILVMLAGMVAGHFFFPKALKKVNEKYSFCAPYA